jgi:uncharacterized protein YkwD
MLRSTRGIGRLTLISALLVVALLAALALAVRPEVGVARGGDCPTASVRSSSKKELRKATICWVNQARKSRGLRQLRKRRKLQKAARKHLKVMLNQRCFSHQCPGERDIERRIANTGYFSGASAFNFGENIGCAPTAKRMVDNWMGSRRHRRYILGKFKHIGSVASTQAPFGQCSGGRGTFVHVFGFRRG